MAKRKQGSMTAIIAIDDALAKVSKGEIADVPNHLKDAHYDGAKKLGRGIGYKYPHDFGGWVEQKYTDNPLEPLELKNIGFEKTLKEWVEKIKGVK
mgnify:FL=1